MICLYVVIFLFGSFCNIRCESQANFTDYPSDNVTTLEGGNLTFTCAVTGRSNRTSNRARMHVKWYLNNETSITINQNLSDGTMATVSSDYRSPLTLSNINRVWNGATVHCAVKIETEDHDQPEPFPVISVLSNSDHVSKLAIIGAIVGVIVIVLLFISMILIIVLCYLRRRKNEMKKDNDDVHFTTESKQQPIESMYAVVIHDRPAKSNGNSSSDNQLNEVKRTKPVESMYADVTRDRKSNTTREGILYADLKFPEEDQRRRKSPVEIQPVIYTKVQKVKK